MAIIDQFPAIAMNMPLDFTNAVNVLLVMVYICFQYTIQC
jgi:hypothetical protein